MSTATDRLDRLAGPLISRTSRVADPGGLLSLSGAPSPLAWVRAGQGVDGLGPVLRVQLDSANAIDEAGERWAELVEHAVIRDELHRPGTGPLAFVSFPFSRRSRAGGVLLVPQTVVGHRDGDWWVTTTSWTGSLPSAARLRPGGKPRPPGRVEVGRGALTSAQWRRRVAAVLDRIGAGDVDKVVLARDLVAQADQRIDLRWVLNRLAEIYPTCWTFAVDGLVGATPEMLVRCERGLVTSRVLAGTIRRTGDDDHDLALAASLARSSKDLEEHEYAVRSVADALARHCGSLNVPESPFVLHLPNVMHLATDVAGALIRHPDGPGPTVLDVAATLHPSAAVCGTPTEAAGRLIGELEQMDRDRYAGPVGWVDARGDGELGIALRAGRLDPADPTSMRLFAGCGIVAGSDPRDELAESEAKLMPMRQALGLDTDEQGPDGRPAR
jgi:menaquinone-specific isochorismate synthase